MTATIEHASVVLLKAYTIYTSKLQLTSHVNSHCRGYNRFM